MTGYASAQYSTANTRLNQKIPSSQSAPQTAGQLGLEIRCVNSRFLDVSFKLPENLRSLEPALREMFHRHLKRGKVELRVSIESASPDAVAEPSIKLLQRVACLQDSIKAWLPQAAPLSVAEVLKLCERESSAAHSWQDQLLELTQRALQELLQARQREGERLSNMLLGHLHTLRALAQKAKPLIPQLVAQQRERFTQRWQEAMALGEGSSLPEVAHDRALAEATAFAIRIDVAEELTRLNSHLDELERLIKAGGEIGKRLDFLIQELHREANTLGSKSAALELTHIAVDMKVLIEQMREQVQNIE